MPLLQSFPRYSGSCTVDEDLQGHLQTGQQRQGEALMTQERQGALWRKGIFRKNKIM